MEDVKLLCEYHLDELYDVKFIVFKQFLLFL